MRVMIAGLAAAVVLALPVVAEAHGPTRQKVTLTVDIAAPPAKVWAVIGNFQDMSWHPAVVKSEGAGDNTPMTATRKLTLPDGNVLEEALEKYDATKMSYFYRITNDTVKFLPVNNYSSTITVKPNGDASTVEWRGAFYRGYMNNDPPPELSDKAAIDAVTGIYKAGLDALKAKVESGT